MKGAHVKKDIKYTEKAGVIAIHHDRYMKQYYSERYNRHIHVNNLENEITKTFI